MHCMGMLTITPTASQPTVAEWKLASVSLHVGAALMAVIVATVILIAVGIVCLLRVKRQRDLRSYSKRLWLL